jgi:hypothetical protein
MHGCWVIARSLRSHSSWGEPPAQETGVQPSLEFSAIRCQLPTSKLYQPSPRLPVWTPRLAK